MNIVINKTVSDKNTQPELINLGQITTSLQDLLDNSTIVIDGNQPIILSIDNLNGDNHKYLLMLPDIKESSVYGFGQNILETDLISLGSVETKPYKVYTALLTQSGIEAPTALVLENTLGAIIEYTYISPGQYRVTASNIYTANKTIVFIGGGDQVTLPANYNYEIGSTSTIGLYTKDGTTFSNDKLNNTSFEVRVYD